MSNVIVKGTNWIKGLALLGLMVALVGALAGAPAASANTIPTCPTAAIGKISVFAVDAAKGNDVSGATVAVYNQNGVLVLKGTTDANGNFAAYSCTGTFNWLAKNLDMVVSQVDEPKLGNAGLGIQPRLNQAVQLDACIARLHDQQSVLSLRQSTTVKVVAPSQ